MATIALTDAVVLIAAAERLRGGLDTIVVSKVKGKGCHLGIVEGWATMRDIGQKDVRRAKRSGVEIRGMVVDQLGNIRTFMDIRGLWGIMIGFQEIGRNARKVVDTRSCPLSDVIMRNGTSMGIAETVGIERVIVGIKRYIREPWVKENQGKDAKTNMIRILVKVELVDFIFYMCKLYAIISLFCVLRLDNASV